MLMHRITLASILFLAAGATSAEAQFCYPGRCGYYRPFMYRPMYRPYAFSHYPTQFARSPMLSGNGHGHGYGYVPGGLGNPYSSGGGQVATTDRRARGGGSVPGRLTNPYTTSASVSGDQRQSSGGGSQRYSESGGNAPSRNASSGNNTSGGGYHQTDAQRSGDSGGQLANGSASGNFPYSCTINDSEEDAGAACKRTSVALKHSGDRCSCHGEWGTVD
jgi:hypothetical protein